MDVRINNKGVAQSRNLTDSQKSVPNFGFVVFEDEKAAMACLTHKPINLPNGHRLNVETKKKNVIFIKFPLFQFQMMLIFILNHMKILWIPGFWQNLVKRQDFFINVVIWRILFLFIESGRW